MHLGGAGIGKADVNAARDQGPHQTFRTIHYSTPVRDVSQKTLLGDQSSPAPFVKGFAGIAAIAEGAMGFFTATPENRRPHGLVACEIAPIMAFLVARLIFREEEL
jgi:hypothetical protein